MTERNKDFLCLLLMLAVLILFFSKILFTGQIIRAPDITNEFYWGVVATKKAQLLDFFKIDLAVAGWDMYTNSGTTVGGGTNASQFLIWRSLILYFFPSPANVAWYIVLQLFFGAAGMYCFCRAIGASRHASFLAGLIFAVAPENASLINAGHVMKVATISFAPWGFYFLEKGFQTRRIIFFLSTGFVLAFQFFNMHWQIAFYTCLCIGAYGLLRSLGILISGEGIWKKTFPKLLGLNLVTMLFFLTTVSISLIPLANWSVDTNRGVQSGANQGKGGLERDEAMSWSLPPEEMASFVIPGFFGLSRQEGGQNPTNIPAYYWGRMVFTQTTDYMGLLPWLLLPLPLLFKRDKYTWLAFGAIAGGIIFSMGKYTFIYHLLFDYFPGIDRFRVPKMMMFIPVMGLGVLAARGVDLLMDGEIRVKRAFRGYLAGVLALPIVLLASLAVMYVWRDTWMSIFIDRLVQPTRYEQGMYLISQRWSNILTETAIAAGLASIYAAAIVSVIRFRQVILLIAALGFLYLGDVWRINNKFMFLVNTPEKAAKIKNPVMEFLSKDLNQYRVLPLTDDPMIYVSNNIPVMFTSNPVQLRRWQEILDNFSIVSAIPDMLNVKYLVYSREQYVQEKGVLGDRYQPVFQSPDGGQVVLENRKVLPKGWLVPVALPITDTDQVLATLRHPSFDPRKVALVESPPPIPLSPQAVATSLSVGDVKVTEYKGDKITLNARPSQNSLLVLGEKYYKGWKATVDGKRVEIYPVNHILRGVYLSPGDHKVEFLFDPLPYKVGKYLTLSSFAFFAFMLARDFRLRRKVSV